MSATACMSPTSVPGTFRAAAAPASLAAASGKNAAACGLETPWSTSGSLRGAPSESKSRNVSALFSRGERLSKAPINFLVTLAGFAIVEKVIKSAKQFRLLEQQKG